MGEFVPWGICPMGVFIPPGQKIWTAALAAAAAILSPAI